jgi:hypothetical protein
VTNIISDTVNLLLGNGDGTFQPPVAYAAGSAPIGIAVGDFNGDGIPDLAVTNILSDTVSVLLNNITQTATATISGISIPGAGEEHLVKATYAGDAEFAASESGTISLTSTLAMPGLALTVSPASNSNFGQQVTLTATLSTWATSNRTTDGGTVVFMNGATTLGTGVLSHRVATLRTSSLPAGNYFLTAVYAGDTNFPARRSPTVKYKVNQKTPTITWTTPAAITFGKALSPTQLNATASVPGTFVYIPAAGTVLKAGTHVLSVSFTPTATPNFTTATKMVSLTVNKAVPTSRGRLRTPSLTARTRGN